MQPLTRDPFLWFVRHFNFKDSFVTLMVFWRLKDTLKEKKMNPLSKKKNLQWLQSCFSKRKSTHFLSLNYFKMEDYFNLLIYSKGPYVWHPPPSNLITSEIFCTKLWNEFLTPTTFIIKKINWNSFYLFDTVYLQNC